MENDIPSLAASWGGDDEERAYVLATQASLPSDLVNPAEVLGDDKWNEMLSEDLSDGGRDSINEFRFGWDWGGLTIQQKANMIATAAFNREMNTYIGTASDAAVKPPVDPVAFAGTVVEARAARARRI